MKILIKIPTRNREEKFFKLLDTCIQRLSGDNEYQILVSCDNDDLSMRYRFVLDKLSLYDNICYFSSPRDTKIGACNRDIDRVPDDWQVVALISDDMMPVVDNWDKYISDGMEKYFPDTDGALWFFDGHREDINTISILGNKYYKRFGYIYYPEYQSFYCDDEYTKVAEKLGKIQKCNWPMTLIEHQHYSFSPEFIKLSNSKKTREARKSIKMFGADRTYKENQEGFAHDIELFRKRSKINYGL